MLKPKRDYEPDELDENGIPKGPRWLWDWTWWVAIIVGGIGWWLATKLSGN